MDNISASLMVDAAPGVTLITAALAAALPPYRVMIRSRRGRARNAVAYISGFFAGLAITTAFAGVVGSFAVDNTPVIAAGLLASFFLPFVGMLRALWLRAWRQTKVHATRRSRSVPAHS